MGHYLTALCGKFCVSRNAEDTFTILLDEGKEEHIKGQIKKRFEQDFHVSGNSISLNEIMITLHYPRDFCSLAEYRALYGYLLEAAQNSGKQIFFEVDEAVKKDYYRRNKVEQAVDRAITENRFEVYYQPIYSLKEKCVVSLAVSYTHLKRCFRYHPARWYDLTDSTLYGVYNSRRTAAWCRDL